MAYTKVNKPTTNIWTSVSTPSRFPPSEEGLFDTAIFDQARFDYVEPTIYISVSKPTGNIWTKINKPT